MIMRLFERFISNIGWYRDKQEDANYFMNMEPPAIIRYLQDINKRRFYVATDKKGGIYLHTIAATKDDCLESEDGLFWRDKKVAVYSLRKVK